MKTNFHTHTQFCDAHSTAEEMVLSAISSGIKFLGFSSHAMWPFVFDDSYLSQADYNSYCNEVRALAKKFCNEINISLGFEADYIDYKEQKTVPSFEQYSDFCPDFLIGSVHFIFNEEGMFPMDWSADRLANGIKMFYGGNVKNAVQRYFEEERQMLEKGNFDILGHCDLIRKFNGSGAFFDETEEWYKSEIKALVEAMSRNGCLVELNTGALARGYQALYPGEYCLELMKAKNIPIIINSDCHNAQNIDFAFDKAIEAAKKAGYTEQFIPYAGSLKPIKL